MAASTHFLSKVINLVTPYGARPNCSFCYWTSIVKDLRIMVWSQPAATIVTLCVPGLRLTLLSRDV